MHCAEVRVTEQSQQAYVAAGVGINGGGEAGRAGGRTVGGIDVTNVDFEYKNVKNAFLFMLSRENFMK